MSRIPKLFRRFTATTPMSIAADWTPLADVTDLCMLGAFQRNVFAGGGHGVEIDASSAGTFDLPGWLPIGVDNRNNQISGFSNANGGTLVVQFRFLVWVSNAAITVQPKVYDITAAALATTSGGTTSSGTSDDYSGTDQQQILTLTLPNALHYFKPKITIAGTPGAGYTAKALALYDCYIDS
jgi:hypothetical protein